MLTSDVELALGELGKAQWGLFTTPQAQRAGVTRPQLTRRAAAGTLVRIGHGVYALRGSTFDEHLGLRAAWLALDPGRVATDRLTDGATGPVVSHASAAALHGFGDLDADRHEFTAPERRQSRRPEVRLHRASPSADEVTIRHGLPVTTPARTVVDLLAAGHDGEHVAGILADAVRARQIDLDGLAGSRRLSTAAARFGLPHGDGPALLRHLLELGGVADQVAADRLAAAARAAEVPLADLVDNVGIDLVLGYLRSAAGIPLGPHRSEPAR